MNIHSQQIAKDELVACVLNSIRQHNITQLLVTQQNKYFGLLHLHDLLQEGII